MFFFPPFVVLTFQLVAQCCADSAHALAERSMAVDSRRVEGGAAAVPSPIPAMGAEFGWADPHRCIPRVPETEPKRRKPRTAAEIHQGLVD